MRKHMQFLLLIVPFLAALSARADQYPAPLVDGDCSEYAQLPAQRINAGSGVELNIYQDDHYVWLCYTYPPGSMGQLDLQLKTNQLASPLNLHVSAQLGEWPTGRDELIPKGPDSDLWWNISGWTANILSPNGMDRSGPTPRTRLKNAKAREIQLAKQRFGHGDWQFAMTIYNVKDQSGKMQELKFPADGSYYTLKAR